MIAKHLPLSVLLLLAAATCHGQGSAPVASMPAGPVASMPAGPVASMPAGSMPASIPAVSAALAPETPPGSQQQVASQQHLAAIQQQQAANQLAASQQVASQQLANSQQAVASPVAPASLAPAGPPAPLVSPASQGMVSALGPEQPSANVTPWAPPTPPVAPSAGGPADHYKPKIVGAFVPHLFQFVRNPPGEACSAISEELATNEATAQAHVQFEVVLGTLDPSLFDSNEELVTADKNAANSLNALSAEMVKEGDGASGDLVNYINRILRCKVEPVADGRGILQRILHRGMEKSLKTNFVKENLVRGSSDYDPAVILDAYGNTLLHLAVYSGGYNVPTGLVDIEDQKNQQDPQRRLNTVYWMLSALQHRNDDGERPLDVKCPIQVATNLKRYFRSFTLYLKIMARKYGIDQKILEGVDELLKTSGSVPVPFRAHG